MLPTTCPAPGAGASKHAYAAAGNTVSATGLVCTDDCEKASVSLQQHNSGRRRSVIQARICLKDFLLLPIPTKEKADERAWIAGCTPCISNSHIYCWVLAIFCFQFLAFLNFY